MNYRTILDFAEEKQIESKFREKTYILISSEDFQYIKPYFEEKFNLLRPGTKNYRTRERLLHCHAVEKKDGTVEIHWDFFNADRLRLLTWIPHFFLDVIPFFMVRIVVLFLKMLALPKYIGKGFIKIYKYVRRSLGA